MRSYTDAAMLDQWASACVSCTCVIACWLIVTVARWLPAAMPADNLQTRGANWFVALFCTGITVPINLLWGGTVITISNCQLLVVVALLFTKKVLASLWYSSDAATPITALTVLVL